MVDSLVAGLNPEQRRAVETTEGPVLVLAGAGSGKTRVITHRIAYLLSQGVPADRILAMTFTNKAAAEMRERIRSMIGPEKAEGLLISTFHSFGLWIVRRSAKFLKLPRNVQVMDESDRRALSKEIRKELNLSELDLTLDEWSAFLMNVKGCGMDPEKAASTMGYRKGGLVSKLYELYTRRLRLAQSLDFDDLILMPVELFEENSEVRELYRNQFDYIMVDEYQDTNLLQFRLLQMLVNDKRNLCVVGDDDQSIYGWRGARVENILEFDQQFPGAAVIKLTRNYRSRQNILALANAVIAKNVQRHSKELWTQSQDKVPAEKMFFDTDKDEALGITRRIRRLLTQKTRPDDVAVLYRTKGQSKVFQEAMRMEGVPYRVVGSFDFFERKEVRDFMAYVKLAVNPNDATAFRRVLNYPARGVGMATLEKLDRYYKQGLPVSEAASTFLSQEGEHLNIRTRRSLEGFIHLIHETNKRQREASKGELVAIIRGLFGQSGMKDDLILKSDFGLKAIGALIGLLEQGVSTGQFTTLQGFVEAMTLQQSESDFSSGDDGKGCVTLMTIHSAKGLEFDNVYLVGLVEGLFPHALSVEEGSGIEEERRLFYVAITRARERLVVSAFQRREERGEMRQWKRSRFFPEMPDSLLIDGQAEDRKPMSREQLMDAFALFEAENKIDIEEE